MLTPGTVDQVFDLARGILAPDESTDFARPLLAPVACAIGADMAVFREVSLGRGAPRIGRHACAGVPERLHSQYLEKFYKLDPAIGIGGEEASGNSVGCVTSLSRTDASARVGWLSEAHKRYTNDFLIPNRLLNNISLHVHATSQNKLFLMDFHRLSPDSAFSDEEFAIAQMICPAIQMFCIRLLKNTQEQTGGTDRRLFKLGDMPSAHLGSADPERAELPCDLTDRERDVALAVLRGMSDKEIARHLGISARTAQNHLRNIYSKNQVHSRAQLMSKLIGSA